jgi:uncharacterized membrane protein YdjX (TVP38/TMEM64 family)
VFPSGDEVRSAECKAEALVGVRDLCVKPNWSSTRLDQNGTLTGVKTGGRIALLLTVIALVIFLFASGALDDFSLEKTVTLIRGYGPWGIAVYLLAFTLVQPLGLSGNMFAVVAGLVWPVPLALALALLGAFGSAMTNVAFARYVAFDWVQARIPPKLRRYERWVTERGLPGVILYRFATFTLHPAQLLIGVLNVPMPRLIIGTLIGFIPAIVMGVVLGGEVTRWLAQALGFG